MDGQEARSSICVAFGSPKNAQMGEACPLIVAPHPLGAGRISQPWAFALRSLIAIRIRISTLEQFHFSHGNVAGPGEFARAVRGIAAAAEELCSAS